MRRAEKIVGAPQERVEEVARVRTARKLEAILNNPLHPLHQEITGQWSKRGNDRFVYPARRCERLGKSFVLVAMKDYNRSHNGRLARVEAT